MTCGIYKLNFANTSKVYIGQSIDIESRYIAHKSAFKTNTATPKLQNAFNMYGYPDLEIIAECSIQELNDLEKEAISIFNSVEDGFNTLEQAGNPTLFGEKVGTAKYSNEEYLNILRLLVQETPRYTLRQISEITGISLYTIRHIAALESHTWMREISPLEYSKLVSIKSSRPFYQRKDYPKIKSPTGEVYEVFHVTNFAKEHGLLQPKLTELLNGKRNHHKGWTRL